MNQFIFSYRVKDLFKPNTRELYPNKQIYPHVINSYAPPHNIRRFKIKLCRQNTQNMQDNENKLK